MKVKSESEDTQSYPTLSDPMDCSLPASSIHGVFQARALEWGAIAKERYTHSNVELQRIARRDRKVFLSYKCKETEEKHKMGKTRDLKKFRDTKGIFHAKMGSIKDRNGMDLTEAKDVKKRWQKYTEQMYKKRSSWPR